MSGAVEVLKQKQDKDQRWNMENSFNGKMIVDIEQPGKPSKWITLKALYILANYL
jgi:hypothetical protein